MGFKKVHQVLRKCSTRITTLFIVYFRNVHGAFQKNVCIIIMKCLSCIKKIFTIYFKNVHVIEKSIQEFEKCSSNIKIMFISY